MSAIQKDSLYEQLNANFTTIMKQRMVENFSGSALPPRWTFTNIQGSNSVDMSDVVNGGVVLQAQGGTNNRCKIDFGDNAVRQYVPNADYFIGIARLGTATSVRLDFGFCETASISAKTDTNILQVNRSASSFYRHQSEVGGSASSQDTDVPVDTTQHQYQIMGNASDLELYIDNVLKSTKTTDLPTGRQQPYLFVQAETGSSRNVFCNYIEVCNT